MKTTIYVFTATGNSLWAAQRIADKLGDAEVLPLARFRNDNP
jgi:flavodoxin